MCFVFIAMYIHCLNLVIIDEVKAVPEAECLSSLLQKFYVYMSGSYVLNSKGHASRCTQRTRETRSVTLGGHVDTRPVKTSWTDYLLYCVYFMR